MPPPESTDRAVFINDGSLGAWMGIGNFGGLAIFPMLCVLEPDYVAELHELLTLAALDNIRALLPEIRDSVDIIMMAADDWGTQANLIASPRVYRSLFLPYHQRINAAVHEIAPDVKCFLHSCGAIYDLIDLVIDSGFDVLNPVNGPLVVIPTANERTRHVDALRYGAGVNARSMRCWVR